MNRFAIPLIALSVALLVADAAAAKEAKSIKHAAHAGGDRCWQPPVCPPHWDPCPPHWNPCPPQICPPHWNPCPPEWGFAPVPAFPANGQPAFQNAAFSYPNSQRNSSGVEASSLFNR